MEFIKEIKPINQLTKSEINDLFQLTKPYYVDAKNVLERELHHNTSIYQLRDMQQRLLSFFMVGWEKHKIGHEFKDVVYLGLSCANENSKENRFASRAYYYFTVDAYFYEQQRNSKLILYGTTATPVVLLTLSKIWDNVRPSLDGSYSPRDKILIEAIKKSTGLDTFSSDHPFVLKAVAKNTRYSTKEANRLLEFVNKNNIQTFENLSIREADGDRLLITCTVPDISKLDRLKAKLFD